MTHDRGVGEHEQRLGHQGEEGGYGEAEDLPVLVPVLVAVPVPPSGALGRIAGLLVPPSRYHEARLGVPKTCVKPCVSVGIPICEGLCR